MTSRELIQNTYIRVAKDSGWKMNYIEVAKFVGSLLGEQPMIVCAAFGSLSLMEKVAKGGHPACHA